MATIHILGREFDLAPYKLGELRRAAPFIDNMQRQSEGGSLTDLMDATVNMLSVLSIGLIKIDPTLTADYLEANVSMADLDGMKGVFAEIAKESGLKTTGEVTAPPADAPAGASTKA